MYLQAYLDFAHAEKFEIDGGIADDLFASVADMKESLGEEQDSPPPEQND